MESSLLSAPKPGLLVPPGDAHASLDFDLFHRYAATASILERMLAEVGGVVRVLELGPNYLNPLALFLDPARVRLTRADVRPVSTDADFLLLASDAPLPFENDSFDAVVALEVLEHMPAEARRGFLTECARVARHGVVLSCPNGVPEVVAAEAYAADSFRQRHGIDHPYLEEHQRFGLPRAEEIVSILRDLDLPHAVFDNSPLDLWLPMLLLSENLLEQQAAGAPQLELNRYFFAHPISGAVAYRKIYVCAKSFDATAALEARDAIDSCSGNGPPAAASALLHHLAAAFARTLAALEHDRAACASELILRREELLAFRRRQYFLYSYVQSARASLGWKLLSALGGVIRFFRSRGFDERALTPWSGLEHLGACAATWRITGPRAHFVVPCHLSAGWLRIQLRFSSDRAGESLLSFDNCDDGADAVMIQAIAVEGAIDRDFDLYLPRPVVGVRFYPLDVLGTVRIEKLKVIALSTVQVAASALAAKVSAHWTGKGNDGRSSAPPQSDRMPESLSPAAPTESRREAVPGPAPVETGSPGRDPDRTETASSAAR